MCSACRDRIDAERFPAKWTSGSPQKNASQLETLFCCGAGKFCLAPQATRSLRSRCQSGYARMSHTLVGDIGGSKSRFALANSAGRPERILVIDNDTATDLEAAVARYLEETGAKPRTAILA